MEIKDLPQQLFKHGVLLGFIIFTFIMISYALTDPETLVSKNSFYAFLIITPIVVGSLALLQFEKTDSLLVNLLRFIVVIIVVLTMTYAYTHLTTKQMSFGSYFINGLGFLIIIIGLAIIYNTVLNNLSKTEGVSGFLINFIFYIPCLVSDFFQYLLNQYRITPNIVFVLFIVEIILILLYYYINRALKKVYLENATVLIDSPIFLDTGVSLAANNARLQIPPSTKTIQNFAESETFRTNYALSMWIFVNPQSPASAAYANETEIMTYGHTDDSENIQHVKPMICYIGDDGKGKKNKYIVYFAQKKEEGDMRYEIELPNQRWNQFVFNYTKGGADLFINGKLERTFEFTKIVPKYTMADNITVGSKNGLDAAICNMAYHYSPLTKSEIANSYTLLVNRNPPILPHT